MSLQAPPQPIPTDSEPGPHAGQFAVSLVVHHWLSTVPGLLAFLEQTPQVGRVLLTLNLPVSPGQRFEVLTFSKVVLIENPQPKGFAANHNAAFRHARGLPWYVVLNPDLVLNANPFPLLAAALQAEPRLGLLTLAVLGPDGTPEDHVRYYPTLSEIALKALGLGASRVARPLPQGGCNAAEERPYWVAGMFHCFPGKVFERIGGYDEGFHLYYEDVDICARLQREGYRVHCEPSIAVTHFAQRNSRRKLQYLVWHVKSMLRYFMKHPCKGLG